MREGTVLLLAHHLKELKLGAILSQYPSLVRQAREDGQDYEEFLLALAELEIQVRQENRLKRRIRDARFPLVKTLEQFHYESAPGLDKRVIRELTEGQYIREHRNVIFVGKTGAGKTHLAKSPPRGSRPAVRGFAPGSSRDRSSSTNWSNPGRSGLSAVPSSAMPGMAF